MSCYFHIHYYYYYKTDINMIHILSFIQAIRFLCIQSSCNCFTDTASSLLKLQWKHTILIHTVRILWLLESTDRERVGEGEGWGKGRVVLGVLELGDLLSSEI